MIASGNMHYLYWLKLTHIEATPLKNVGPAPRKAIADQPVVACRRPLLSFGTAQAPGSILDHGDLRGHHHP